MSERERPGCSRARRRTVHGGHDRQTAPDHPRHDLTAVGERKLAQRGVLGELVDVAEVAAGREGASGAHDDHHPRLVVGVELGEQRGQAAVEDMVGRVQIVGPVQRDDPDRAVLRDQQLVR